MKISLDSNVFRDQDFIDWLQANSNKFEIKLSVIVALETFHWYNLRGIAKELFEKELEALEVEIIDLTLKEIYEISANAKKATTTLPFKHHARDFIIGTQTLEKKAILITQNINHFKWMGKEKVLTPDELVLEMEKVGST